VTKGKAKQNRPLSLWQRLDRIREREGLTNCRFAEVLGMSRQQYSNLKGNDQRMTTAWRIAVEAMESYGTTFIKPTDGI
jgi:transcriptional regulator with XRE-family HTH domain